MCAVVRAGTCELHACVLLASNSPSADEKVPSARADKVMSGPSRDIAFNGYYRLNKSHEVTAIKASDESVENPFFYYRNRPGISGDYRVDCGTVNRRSIL